MIQKLDKEQLIARVESEIKVRNELMVFYNRVFLPTFQKFNGKVYNIRFIKALREAKDDELMYVRELENDHVVIEKRLRKYSYTDVEQLYIRVLLTDGRIDVTKSISDKTAQAWLINFQEYTKELQRVINNYDLYMDKADLVIKSIEEYSKIPNRFRENIEFRKKFYL